MGVLIKPTFILSYLSWNKKMCCQSEAGCGFMSVFTWPQTDPCRWTAASFVAFWPYRAVLIVLLAQFSVVEFATVLCPCLFLCFDSAGHMLLWARIFFSREQVGWGTLVCCVLGLGEGDYGGIYIATLTHSFRHCQSVRSSVSCNCLSFVLWRWMCGWCKWGSGYVLGFL